MIERFHRTLNSMLAKVIREDQRDWDDKLPAVMMAYRASTHESTGFSPNRLVLGRELRLPVDLVYPKPTDSPETPNFEQYVQDFQNNIEEAFIIVRRNLGAAAQLRKDHYDCKVKACANFKAGDRVWYFYPRRVQGKSPKWQKWYTGPYEIVKEIDSHNFVIRRGPRTKLIVVHRDKLKMCYSPPPVNGEICNELVESDCIVPDDLHLQTTSDQDEIDDRPRRINRRPPKHLQQYVCRCVASDFAMATKYVQSA
jgi:hypothetical protein